MITSLIYLTLSLSDPNTLTIQDFAKHWLEVKSADKRIFDPNVNPKHVFYIWPCDGNRDNYIVVRCKDPNDSLEVVSWHKNRVDMLDFALFSRVYKGDPNYVPPVEPNTPADPCEPNEPTLAEILSGVTDPNLASFIKGLMKQ